MEVNRLTFNERVCKDPRLSYEGIVPFKEFADKESRERDAKEEMQLGSVPVNELALSTRL